MAHCRGAVPNAFVIGSATSNIKCYSTLSPSVLSSSSIAYRVAMADYLRKSFRKIRSAFQALKSNIKKPAQHEPEFDFANRDASMERTIDIMRDQRALLLAIYRRIPKKKLSDKFTKFGSLFLAFFAAMPASEFYTRKYDELRSGGPPSTPDSASGGPPSTPAPTSSVAAAPAIAISAAGT